MHGSAEFHGLGEALWAAFPGRDDPPLALALLRLLAEGEPASIATLAAAADRRDRDVAAQLSRWPNVERNTAAAVIGFSGLTLRTTPHELELAGRKLHAWCAWDTLFLPALLDRTARVRSAAASTGTLVDLVVSPRGIEAANRGDLHVSFPSIAGIDPADITGSFCCHVFFLAGAEAARAWSDSHPDGSVVDIQAAFALGRRGVEPLLAADLLQPADEVTP